jgi:hypothetical protein
MWTNLQLRVSRKETDDYKAALEKHTLSAPFDWRGKITFLNDKFCAISKHTREGLPS